MRGRLFLRFRHHHGATFGAHRGYDLSRFLEDKPIDTTRLLPRAAKQRRASLTGSRGQHRARRTARNDRRINIRR